jgi:hypothetical protein
VPDAFENYQAGYPSDMQAANGVYFIAGLAFIAMGVGLLWWGVHVPLTIIVLLAVLIRQNRRPRRVN